MPSGSGSERARVLGEVLASVVAVSRDIRAERRTPFHGRTLTASQMDALFHLAHGPAPVTPGALAGVLGVTPGAVTQLVDALRAEGLVETSTHPDDARSRVIRLSAEARDQVAAFELHAVARMLPRFDSLDDDELASLARLLRRTQGDR